MKSKNKFNVQISLKETKMTKSMNFLTANLSQLAAKDSDAQRPFSSQCWLVNNYQVSMRSHINQFLSVMWTSEKTCTATLLWVEEQPCSQVFQRDWASKWQLWLHQLWRWRYSPHKKESFWFGLVVQFYHHCQLSKQCGSQRLSIKKVVHK